MQIRNDMRVCLLMVGVISWMVSGALLCNFYDGIGVLPHDWEGLVFHKFRVEIYCWIMWLYIPLIFPPCPPVDRFIVYLYQGAEPNFTLKSLSIERTYWRLVGVGCALAFWLSPMDGSPSAVLISLAGLIWWLIARPIAIRLHTDPQTTQESL